MGIVFGSPESPTWPIPLPPSSFFKQVEYKGHKHWTFNCISFESCTSVVCQCQRTHRSWSGAEFLPAFPTIKMFSWWNTSDRFFSTDILPYWAEFKSPIPLPIFWRHRCVPVCLGICLSCQWQSGKPCGSWLFLLSKFPR